MRCLYAMFICDVAFVMSLQTTMVNKMIISIGSASGTPGLKKMGRQPRIARIFQSSAGSRIRPMEELTQLSDPGTLNLSITPHVYKVLNRRCKWRSCGDIYGVSTKQNLCRSAIDLAITG
jgi:hypothetical protein